MNAPLLWALSVMTIGNAVLSLLGALWGRLRKTRARPRVVPPVFSAIGLTATIVVWLIVFVEYSRPGVYPSAVPLILAFAAIPLAIAQRMLLSRWD